MDHNKLMFLKNKMKKWKCTTFFYSENVFHKVFQFHFGKKLIYRFIIYNL